MTKNEIQKRIRAVFCEVISNYDDDVSVPTDTILGSNYGNVKANLSNHCIFFYDKEGDRNWVGGTTTVIYAIGDKINFIVLYHLDQAVDKIDGGKIEFLSNMSYAQLELSNITYVATGNGLVAVRFITGCPPLSNDEILNLIDNGGDVTIDKNMKSRIKSEAAGRNAYVNTLKNEIQPKSVQYGINTILDSLDFPDYVWYSNYANMYKTGTPLVTLPDPRNIIITMNHEPDVSNSFSIINEIPTADSPPLLINFDGMTLSNAFVHLLDGPSSFESLFFNFFGLLRSISMGLVINDTRNFDLQCDTYSQLNKSFNSLTKFIPYIFQFGKAVDLNFTPGQVLNQKNANYRISETDPPSKEIVIACFLNYRPPSTSGLRNRAVNQFRRYVLASYRQERTKSHYKLFCAIFNMLRINGN